MKIIFILPGYRFKNAQFGAFLSCRIPQEFDNKNIGPVVEFIQNKFPNTTVTAKTAVVETPGGYWKLNYYAPFYETVLVQYCKGVWLTPHFKANIGMCLGFEEIPWIFHQ